MSMVRDQFLRIAVSSFLMVCFWTFGYSKEGENVVYLNNKSISKYLIVRDGIRIFHLPAGNYVLEETLKLSSDMILEGDGSNTIIRPAVPFMGQRFITNSDSVSGNKNIRIKSLKVEFDHPILIGHSPGVMRFENVENIHITDIEIAMKSDFFGVDYASGIRNASVEGCLIVNRGKGGCIMVRNFSKNPALITTDIIIRKNKLASALTDESLAVFGWLGVVKNVIIEANSVLAHGASFGITAFGIDSPSDSGFLSEVKIVDNEVDGGNIGGIGVKGGARNIEVKSNRIIGCRGDGIFIHSGGDNLPNVSGVYVDNNMINNVGRHGIFASGENVQLKSNNIDTCKNSGIYVSGEVQVLGNYINNAYPAIIVDGGRGQVIRDNKIIKSNIRILNPHPLSMDNNLFFK